MAAVRETSRREAPASLWRWAPNALTFLRLALAPVILVWLIALWGAYQSASLGPAYAPGLLTIAGLVALAGFLDFADGWLARRLKAESAFGQRWDPIADKLVTGATLIGVALVFPIVAPAALLIIARDIVITGLRLCVASTATVQAPSRLAKSKTALLFVGLIMLLAWSLPIRLSALVMDAPGALATGLADGARSLGLLGIYVAAVLSVATALDYLRRILRL